MHVWVCLEPSAHVISWNQMGRPELSARDNTGNLRYKNRLKPILMVICEQNSLLYDYFWSEKNIRMKISHQIKFSKTIHHTLIECNFWVGNTLLIFGNKSHWTRKMLIDDECRAKLYTHAHTWGKDCYRYSFSPPHTNQQIDNLHAHFHI